MAEPTLTATAERLYAMLEPIAGPDEANGWPLAIYAGGFSAIIELLTELVADTDDGVPGWAAHLFAPDTEPSEWLPVTELFVGVTPLPAVDDAGRRLRIKHVDGRYRGTPGAIKGAARQFLVGPDGTPETATVYLIPRYGGVATTYRVTTLASETPDASLVQAALDEQKPAGFTLTYTAITGGSWTTLEATHASWTETMTDRATWADVIDDPSVT